MKFDKRTTKRVLSLIFFIMLMDIAGLSILGPVASYIVKRYSNDALMITMLTVITRAHCSLPHRSANNITGKGRNNY